MRVAGAVITRQRPGTAKGFVFLTLEDETGIANIIIRPDLFAEQRMAVINEPFLLVEGMLQNQEGVTSVRAERMEGLGGDDRSRWRPGTSTDRPATCDTAANRYGAGCERRQCYFVEARPAAACGAAPRSPRRAGSGRGGGGEVDDVAQLAGRRTSRAGSGGREQRLLAADPRLRRVAIRAGARHS